jgi:hypothetical protein
MNINDSLIIFFSLLNSKVHFLQDPQIEKQIRQFLDSFLPIQDFPCSNLCHLKMIDIFIL